VWGLLVGGALFFLLYAVALVHHGFSTRTAPSSLELALARSLRTRSIPKHYKTLQNPIASNPKVLAEAKAHWADHCAQCHANDGSGDVEIGRNLYPRPPDMRKSATQQLTDGEIYYTIDNGVRLTGMPAFGAPGDDDLASWKLVAFIRYLPQMSAGEAAAMEKLNPKTPEEFEEEKCEEEFLNGTSGGESAWLQNGEMDRAHRVCGVGKAAGRRRRRQQRRPRVLRSSAKYLKLAPMYGAPLQDPVSNAGGA